MPQYTLYADTAREADEWITVLQQATCVLCCLCIYVCMHTQVAMHKGVAYCTEFNFLPIFCMKHSVMTCPYVHVSAHIILHNFYVICLQTCNRFSSVCEALMHLSGILYIISVYILKVSVHAINLSRTTR